ILTIGDSHIPRRAKNIPVQICDVLEKNVLNGKFDFTFFTGDVVKAPRFMSYLKKITQSEVLVVIGNMDYYGGNQNAPIYQHIDISIETKENLTVGLTHGHQIHPRGDHTQLGYLAIDNNYNILISGHTHKEEVVLTNNGVLLLNPGSVTGAWSFVASRNPSIIVLILDEKTGEIDVFLYRYEIRPSKKKKKKFSFIFKNKTIQEY
ncbi:MAG: YfcE family phosphodiesterase, partial [Promethearchaeota archaeon]